MATSKGNNISSTLANLNSEAYGNVWDEGAPSTPTNVNQEPPTYSDAIGSRAPQANHDPSQNPEHQPSQDEQVFASWARCSQVNFTKYFIPGSEMLEDNTVVVIRDENFLNNPKAIVDQIRLQADLPPRLLMRIRGIHKAELDKEHLDFDIRLSLQQLLMRPDATQQNYLNVQNSPSGSPTSLLDWVNRFCRDRTSPKQLTLERKVKNFDTDFLEGQVRHLIASSGYVGQISVTFPILCGKIAFRAGKSQIMSLKDAWSWIIGSSSRSDPAKRYDIVQSIWPYSNHPPGTLEGRECVVQSETAWWYGWKTAIRNGALDRRLGYIGLEDLIDSKLGVVIPERKEKWGYRDVRCYH